MKLARLRTAGSITPVVITDDATFDISGLTADIDGAFLAGNGISQVRSALADGSLPALDSVAVADHGYDSPVARPSAVLCIGMNYVAHAAESGSAPPTVPVLFMKLPNTVSGPDDMVTIPRNSVKTDWEVELAVVIGKRTSYLDSPEQAKDHIAGFTIVDDLSERAFQLEQSGGQWSKGKCCAGFSPTGPWLVPTDEVDYTNVRLRSWVNGEPRQDSSTRDLIFGVDEIIYQLSQYLVLEPGDLVLTGTPEGVALSGRFPYLKDGDVVEIEIDGLGRQRHEFVAWTPAEVSA